MGHNLIMVKNQANSGDFVEVHLTHKIWEGILLDVPASEKGVVLLKLINGYNIGFKKKDVSEIKLIKKKIEVKSGIDFATDSEKKNVAMIITGGTIAASYDAKTGGVSWLDSPEKLFKFYPGIFDVCNVSKVEVPFMKGSEDMDYKDWKKVAKVAEKLLNDKTIEGVIVTQGTDTLHYSSAALSFFLGEVNKPVIMTYSQRSIDRASSDASLNLKCSAMMALSDVAQVMTVGHGSGSDDFCYALNGVKVRKLHSSRRDAFRPVNAKPIAKIYEDRMEMESCDYNIRDNEKKVKADTNFEEKVALLKFYPGQDPEILDYYLDAGYKGIVVEMVGLGQVATSDARKSWSAKLKKVIDSGMIVCAAAQTINGALNPLVYSTGRELVGTGVIYLKDMLSETAWIKLSWVLGHEEWVKDKEIVREKMLNNFCNEFNERL